MPKDILQKHILTRHKAYYANTNDPKAYYEKSLMPKAHLAKAYNAKAHNAKASNARGQSMPCQTTYEKA